MQAEALLFRSIWPATTPRTLPPCPRHSSSVVREGGGDLAYPRPKGLGCSTELPNMAWTSAFFTRDFVWRRASGFSSSMITLHLSGRYVRSANRHHLPGAVRRELRNDAARASLKCSKVRGRGRCGCDCSWVAPRYR